MTSDDSTEWGNSIQCDEGYTLTRRRNGLLEITAINKSLLTVTSSKIRVGAFISHIGSVDLSKQYNETEFIKKISINQHDITYVEFKNPSAKLKARLSSSALVDIQNRNKESHKRSRALRQQSIQELNDLRILEQRLMLKEDVARLSFQYDEKKYRPYHTRRPPIDTIRNRLQPCYVSEIFQYSKYMNTIERCQHQFIFDDRWLRWKKLWATICSDHKLQSIWCSRQWHIFKFAPYSFSNEKAQCMSQFSINDVNLINKYREDLFNKTYNLWKREERMHINVFAFVGLWEPNDRNYDLLLLNRPTCGTYDIATRNQQISLRNNELVEFRERYFECCLMENEDQRHQILQINHSSKIPSITSWRSYVHS